MKSKFRKRWYLFVPLIIAGLAAFGFITMYLWNWLMPTIFHLPEITFWQTVGLMLLSRFILGGFGGNGRHKHAHCNNRMHEKWENMTPEERENFKEHIRMHRPPWMNRYQKEKKDQE